MKIADIIDIYTRKLDINVKYTDTQNNRQTVDMKVEREADR